MNGSVWVRFCDGEISIYSSFRKALLSVKGIVKEVGEDVFHIVDEQGTVVAIEKMNVN